MLRARNTLFLIYRYEKLYYRHIKSIQHVVLLLSKCDIFTSPSFIFINELVIDYDRETVIVEGDDHPPGYQTALSVVDSLLSKTRKHRP